jgi:hypothetical protein
MPNSRLKLTCAEDWFNRDAVNDQDHRQDWFAPVLQPQGAPSKVSHYEPTSKPGARRSQTSYKGDSKQTIQIHFVLLFSSRTDAGLLGGEGVGDYKGRNKNAYYTFWPVVAGKKRGRLAYRSTRYKKCKDGCVSCACTTLAATSQTSKANATIKRDAGGCEKCYRPPWFL